MIIYAPFWDTLKKISESSYSLINKYHVSSATIDKLRNNKPMTTTTLNDLCILLECDLTDIMMFIPDESEHRMYTKD